MYKLIKTFYGDFIVQTEENFVTTFAVDPDNTDYQKYLRWLEESNIPEAAD